MSTTEPRNHRWKIISNSKNKDPNKSHSSQNKRKFTPLRESFRQENIFQKSRQRSNSSMAQLNKSKDSQKKLTKQKKTSSKIKETKSLSGQKFMLISSLKPNQLKDVNSVEKTKRNLLTLAQIQKQFRMFKQKVLTLLQQQQEQINLLAKQILSACQEKIYNFNLNKTPKQCPHCKMALQISSLTLNQQSNFKDNLLSPKNKQRKVKQIEDINRQLNSKIDKIKSPQKQISNPELKTTSKQIPKIDFQQIYSKFQNAFKIIHNLNQGNFQIQQVTESLNIQKNQNQGSKGKLLSRIPNLRR